MISIYEKQENKIMVFHEIFYFQKILFATKIFVYIFVLSWLDKKSNCTYYYGYDCHHLTHLNNCKLFNLGETNQWNI